MLSTWITFSTGFRPFLCDAKSSFGTIVEECIQEALRLRRDIENKAIVFCPAPESLFPLNWHWSNPNITKGDRPVIALQSKRPNGSFREPAAGLAAEFHMLVDHFAVVYDFDEDGVGDLLTLVVEARGVEDDIKGLPLARR